MTGFATALPQLGDDLFLTDGGLETTMTFLEGWDLPHFAAFHLHRSPEGEAALRRYFQTYVALARRFGAGLILESATWRASADWGRRLGYSRAELAEMNRRAIRLLADLRGAQAACRMVISGCLGPRGDGYVPAERMSEGEAEAYHLEQAASLAEAGADMLSAITMNYAEEATGIARAARRVGLPVAVSFTVETNGRLPTGQGLGDALRQVDDHTDGYPAYYMINCAHPTHFAPALRPGEAWTERVRGLRSNASRKSHAELNESAELDIGDPVELGRHHAALQRAFPHITVMGGCCGTDHRHIAQMAAACAPLRVPA